jgi:hypothetical protein
MLTCCMKVGWWRISGCSQSLERLEDYFQRNTRSGGTAGPRGSKNLDRSLSTAGFAGIVESSSDISTGLTGPCNRLGPSLVSDNDACAKPSRSSWTWLQAVLRSLSCGGQVSPLFCPTRHDTYFLQDIAPVSRSSV